MAFNSLKLLLSAVLSLVLITPVYGDGSDEPLRIVAARSVYPLVIDKLIERFNKLYPDTNIEVVTHGSLQAINELREGNADVLMTYYPPEERRLLEEGLVKNRFEFMFGSYAIFGPPGDEFGLLQEVSIKNVLKKLANKEAAFIAPSPNGGTYQKMSDLWANAGINPDWSWFEVTDTTPLGAMRIAAEQQAYTFADLGTYMMNRKELSTWLVPLYQGGYELYKPFSIMQVNNARVARPEHPHAAAFIDFITSDGGQQIIRQANKDRFNAPVFFPAAHFDPNVIEKRENEELERTTRNLNIVSGLLVIMGVMFFVVLFMIFRARYFHKEKLNAEISRGIAEQASRAKSEFLSKMSHELRTPLNAILGFSQVLEMNEKDKEKKANLNEVVKAGNHLHNLIDDVLELSNIENNRVEISISEVDIAEIIKDSLVLCQESINRHKVVVNVVGHKKCKVNVDPTRLKEILVNLITNAAKYNSENGTITIKTHKMFKEGRVRLSVIDTGRGISIKQQRHLFEPFERLGLESTGIEGTGIGLVICKNLVELMSGSIGFESKQGHGSEFWVEFALMENSIVSDM